MARADLILGLVKAGAKGDESAFLRTVEALAADERAKNHGVLADRLMALLHQNNNGRSKSALPLPRSSAGPLLTEIRPQRRVSDLILPELVNKAIDELVEEQNRADLLRSHNLEPRNRVLLAGPPGNGKTSLAEALAERLSVPLLAVRYESVIGSYLGETAQRIVQVFEQARNRQCVLFLDEFDAVGKERGDIHETGEIKRVVSSLLLQIDSLPSYVVVVAASNHPELLDRAVWRRFQLRLELPMPNPDQVSEWFRRFETRTGLDLGMAPKTLAQRLQGLCFAEIEEFGVGVLRRIALAEPAADTARILKDCLEQWQARYQPKSQMAPREGE